MELRSDANVAEVLLTRQNCMVLAISATLEIFDAKPVSSFFKTQPKRPALGSFGGFGLRMVSSTYCLGQG